MPAPDETEVVAAPLRGNALAQVVRECWDAGRAVVPLNPALTRSEQDGLLARLRPTHLHDGDGLRPLAGGVPTTADVVAIVVTSGTTGEPKGVELTAAGREVMGRGYSEGVGATADDRWLACLPLHHVASLGVLARSYVTGVPYTVHDHFEVDAVARSPAAEHTTIVSLVPTTLLRMLDAGAPLHEFRVVITGGAPCPPNLRTRAEAMSVNVVDAYGMSETWSGFALNGVPIAGAHVRLDDGTNEILVRGAMVMRGYRLDEALTAEVLRSDGSLATGDVGTIDEAGHVRVVDRLKDLVITGGVNVSPTEIEGVLAHHEAIADVCVIGVPDDEWGERVVAYVVPNGPTVPSLEELRAFARNQLSASKLPREVRAIDAIPRSGSGKPLRRDLRDRA